MTAELKGNDYIFDGFGVCVRNSIETLLFLSVALLHCASWLKVRHWFLFMICFNNVKQKHISRTSFFYHVHLVQYVTDDGCCFSIRVTMRIDIQVARVQSDSQGAKQAGRLNRPIESVNLVGMKCAKQKNTMFVHINTANLQPVRNLELASKRSTHLPPFKKEKPNAFENTVCSFKRSIDRWIDGSHSILL